MAATEVNHFPLCMQLDCGAPFLANGFGDRTASPPSFPPHLIDLLQARSDGTAFFSATGGLCV